MGGPRERIREARAEGFALGNVAALNTIALEVDADRDARVLPRAPGLPDEWFEHDGQLTKRDIRAVTLSALAPRSGEILWDVGAGSGSVAIEWMLADPANRAIAIEARHDRAARIARNALTLGVPALSHRHGRSAASARGTARAGRRLHRRRRGCADVSSARWDALPPGGRIVVNAVTLETQAACVGWRARLAASFCRSRSLRAEPVGRFTGWRAAMAVVQWRLTKP